MIRATDRLSDVLARDQRLVEVFVAASPAFENLENPTARKTMARLVTVEQAARIARMDPGALVTRLNDALSAAGTPPSAPIERSEPMTSAEPLPDSLRATPPARIVDVDVREDLRAGREPFGRIMRAVEALPSDGVLRVRAIFEPVPLYGVLGKRGLAHFTERFAPDDFRVWFHREGAEGAAVPAVAADTPSEGDDVVVLDVRGLEPPEPMVRTLEALAAMPRGKTLVQLNVRVPQLLLPKLEERGFTYEVREQSRDLVRVLIRHR